MHSVYVFLGWFKCLLTAIRLNFAKKESMMKKSFSLLLLGTVLCASASVSLSGTPTSVAEDEEDPYFLLTAEADSAFSIGDYEEACARLIDAMSVRPNHPSNALLMSNLGMAYHSLGHDSLALSTLDEALRRYPAMTTIRGNRALVLLGMGRDREAYDDFSRVLSVDSLNADARFYHGMIALYDGKADVAEADFSVLKNCAPSGGDTAAALAALYSLTGRDREAIPYFEKLVSSENSAAEYYAGLAGCHLALGNLSEASTVIADGMKKYPDDAELFYYRAWLNRDRYRMDDAHADARRAVELGASAVKVKGLFAKKSTGK